MKYTIDTVNKTIEIKDALIEEVVKLSKKYKGYRVISMWNITYPFYPIIPYWQPIGTAPTITDPYYYVKNVDCITTDGTGTDITYKTDVPYTLTSTVIN